MGRTNDPLPGLLETKTKMSYCCSACIYITIPASEVLHSLVTARVFPSRTLIPLHTYPHTCSREKQRLVQPRPGFQLKNGSSSKWSTPTPRELDLLQVALLQRIGWWRRTRHSNTAHQVQNSEQSLKTPCKNPGLAVLRARTHAYARASTFEPTI